MQTARDKIAAAQSELENAFLVVGRITPGDADHRLIDNLLRHLQRVDDILVELTGDRMTETEAFFQSYLEAALWTGVDDDDLPLDGNYTVGDIAAETREEMRRHCVSFLAHPRVKSALERCQQLHNDGLFTTPGGCDVCDFAGYDFWMTRNGHGVGFWETGDWPEYEGSILDKIADTFGCYDLYVGDDGLIHGC